MHETFLFDKKDNINFRSFITSGSIWGSDYSSNNDFKNRISAGISLDILTAVFPVSFSYAIPIEKEDDDKVREFKEQKKLEWDMYEQFYLTRYLRRNLTLSNIKLSEYIGNIKNWGNSSSNGSSLKSD